MSIVVTCSCDMTYRLPDRYAGKRCRCRECGAAIKVPRADEEVPVRTRKSRKKKRKAKAASDDSRHRAQRTTRRLGSQEQEIRGERRALRRAYRPVSESMHQIAPLALSGAVERPQTLGPAKARRKAEEARRRDEQDRKDRRRTKGKKAKRKQARTKSTGKAKSTEGKKDRRAKKDGSKQDRRAKKGKTKAPSKGARSTTPKAPQRRKKGKGLPSKGAKVGGLERGRGRALAARTKSRGAVAARRGKGRRGVEDEGLELSTPRRNNRMIGIAACAVAALCLLVGWAFGAGLKGAGSGPGSDFAAQMAEVEELKQHRQWDFASAKLKELEAAARAAGDEQAAAQVRDAFVAVDMMVQLSTIADDETKLATLLSYADHADPSVRLGIAMELRGLASQYEAQEALANLANDADPKVQAAARQGLVAAGGPFSIPYLQEAIVSSAATGGKLGEQALQRALELYEPEVVPVLIKALEVRKSAPPQVLAAILDHLHEMGEPSAVQAAQAFTSHADEAVKTAAQRIVDDLG